MQSGSAITEVLQCKKKKKKNKYMGQIQAIPRD